MTDAFYLSKRWQKLRKSVLVRDKYICQYYKRYGKLVPATLVHHILPREVYPEYEWAPWNLISLSKAAHNKMHDQANGKLTEDGEAFALRLRSVLGMTRTK